MKTNKILLATILVFVVLAAIPVMSAATAMSSPVASGNYSDTLTTTVTVDKNGDFNMTNVTCYYNATGGVATTFFVEMLNSTPQDLVFQNTTAITAWTELTTYNISCEVRNTTTLNTTLSVASITIDSTDPVCSLVALHDNFAWKDTQLITWTNTDAVSLVSTLVTIDRPEDGADITDTDANEARTLTSQETKYRGDWTVTLLGTDRPGNTCTETVTFKSYMPDGDIWEAEEPAEPVDRGKIFLFLIVAAVILWFVFGKKK